MNKIKKGDIVEIRTDITSFMTLKLIGEVTRVMRGGRFVVRDDKGVKIGIFSPNQIRKR